MLDWLNYVFVYVYFFLNNCKLIYEVDFLFLRVNVKYFLFKI